MQSAGNSGKRRCSPAAGRTNGGRGTKPAAESAGSHPGRDVSPGVSSPEKPSAGTGSTNGFLHIEESEIRRAAAECGPDRSLGNLLLRRVIGNAIVRGLKRLPFSSATNGEACRSYRAMSVAEFSAVNGLQSWANWRTIPRNLSDRLPAQPAAALDLCCGIGDSTTVLAYYLPPGSAILGFDVNPSFVRAAESRDYRNRTGGAVSVVFRAQDVLDTFHGTNGEPIDDGSIDLVNACGAVAVHFDRDSKDRLAAECARVIRREGMANIDALRFGDDAAVLADIFGRHGFWLEKRSLCCPLDRYVQLSMRKVGP